MRLDQLISLLEPKNRSMASDASDSSIDDDFEESDPGEQMDWEIEVGDDPYGSVFELCTNYQGFSEFELVQKLTRIPELVPEALRATNESNEYGYTLLHYAIDFRRSFDFCKVLIDHNPDIVKTSDEEGTLPIHVACYCGEIHNQLIKFLIAQFPESVNIPDAGDWYPVHGYISSEGNRLDVLQLLLKCDEKVLSTPNVHGDLPLHSAVEKYDFVEIIKEVYDAYPQALHGENENGYIPLDIAQHYRDNQFHSDDTILNFLEEQMQLENQARQITTPDENGRLPLHTLLLKRNNFPVTSIGTIKLMVAANPNSVSITDNEGRTPLHIASRTSDPRIVKFLVEKSKASLNISDSKGNFALHHACVEGSCDVVNFILSQSTQGVSMHNSDGKLPIELLLYEVGIFIFDKNGNQWHRYMERGQKYRGTQEYVEAVYHLLRAYPDALKELAE